MSVLNIQLAEGWEEIPPPGRGPSLMIESEGELSLYRNDFTLEHKFGPVGPVDCPLAYDAQASLVFRYISAPRIGRRDFSQIRAYDVKMGTSELIAELPLNQWVLWLLEWIRGGPSEGGRLFGLVATDDTSSDMVVLKHQLFLMKPFDGIATKRPLCRDAYAPIAFSLQRRRILFVGAEGIYTVGLNGERHAELALTDRAIGRGAAFSPNSSDEVLIGGSGLRLWNYKTGECRKLTQQGQYPCWSKDGRGIWFSESSADLLYYDIESRETTRVLQVARNHDKEYSLARPIRISPDGRYLGVQLSGKRMKGISRNSIMGARERVYEQSQAFFVLDLKTSELWRHEGFVTQFLWI